MNQESSILIHDLLHPWIGAADDDEVVAAYSSLDPNNEASVIVAIRGDILPHVMTMPPEKRMSISQALEEIMDLPAEQIERTWESILPPFSLPTTPALLFRWIRATIVGPPDSQPQAPRD